MSAGAGHRARMTASMLAMLAIAVPAHAAGKPDNNGHKSSPPSSSPLPSAIVGPAVTAAPLAWLDDATLLAPGAMALTVSTMRWTGSDLTEVDFPIVDASVGVTSRVQIGASVPRVVGSADGTGPIGGLATSYVRSKIALLRGESGVKLAASPLVEILGGGAAAALAPGESRAQLGLPVSMEIAEGPTRMFASTGIFSRGAWFAGGGVGLEATPRVGISLSFTRSWARDSTTSLLRDRRELSGGVSYFLRPNMGLFGALGRTIATADADGAGTTVSGGVTFVMGPFVTK